MASGGLHASAALVAVNQQLNISQFHLDCPGEGIDGGDSDVRWVPPRQVKRRSSRRGNAHIVNDTDLIGLDALFPDLHSGCSTAVGVDDRGRQGRIDPPGTMQSSRGKARQDGAMPRAQPTRPSDIHILMQRDKPTPQPNG